MVTIDTTLFITKAGKNQPSRPPALKPAVCLSARAQIEGSACQPVGRG
jgi:hypothetical protein